MFIKLYIEKWYQLVDCVYQSDHCDQIFVTTDLAWTEEKYWDCGTSGGGSRTSGCWGSRQWRACSCCPLRYTCASVAPCSYSSHLLLLAPASSAASFLLGTWPSRTGCSQYYHSCIVTISSSDQYQCCGNQNLLNQCSESKINCNLYFKNNLLDSLSSHNSLQDVERLNLR